jgi:hypothetical protein
MSRALRDSSPVRLTDELAKPPGCPCGSDDAEAGFRVADAEARCADPEVGGIGKFRAAAESEPVEGGDDGHGKLGNPVEQRGVDAGQCVIPTAFSEFGDVGTGREECL